MTDQTNTSSNEPGSSREDEIHTTVQMPATVVGAETVPAGEAKPGTYAPEQKEPVLRLLSITDPTDASRADIDADEDNDGDDDDEFDDDDDLIDTEGDDDEDEDDDDDDDEDDDDDDDDEDDEDDDEETPLVITRDPNELDAEDKVRLMAGAADAVRAEDIMVLDLRELTIIADFFLICTGKSSIQLRAIADRIEDKLRDAGIRKPRIEGYQEATWILLDYGDVVVHLMAAEQREFYRLEEFWAKAPQLEIELLPEEARSTRPRPIHFDTLMPIDIDEDDDDDEYDEDDLVEDEDESDETDQGTEDSEEEDEEDEEDEDLIASDFEIDPDSVVLIDDDEADLDEYFEDTEAFDEKGRIEDGSEEKREEQEKHDRSSQPGTGKTKPTA